MILFFRRCLAALLAALPAVAQSPAVEFARDVQPLFKKRCIGCHGAAVQSSGRPLDQREDALRGGYSGPVIVPGKSADSKLIIANAQA